MGKFEYLGPGIIQHFLFATKCVSVIKGESVFRAIVRTDWQHRAMTFEQRKLGKTSEWLLRAAL